MVISPQKITPMLMFEGRAEEAMTFYVSLFEDSRIVAVNHYGPGAPSAEGSVMTVTAEIAGQQVIGLNGGPQYAFTEAFSFFVDCDSQEEVDRLWGALTAEGEEGPCGWLKDRYGLSWQIVPAVLLELLQDPDKEKAGRVMQAMLKMRKLDVAELERAAAEA